MSRKPGKPAGRTAKLSRRPSGAKPASVKKASVKKTGANVTQGKRVGATRGGAPGDVGAIIASLKQLGSSRYRDDMFNRYGIKGKTAEAALGVPVGKLQQVAKTLRTRDPAFNHALAEALWEWGGGQYEARMLASFVDEPSLVTEKQMDRWTKAFDNWGICDTVCFKLFDRVPAELAFSKIEQWSRSEREFVKRAAFALLASLGAHDKKSGDEPFAKCLPLIERAAEDDRNFVKKGVSWALRVVGRRSPGLHASAVAMATRLAASEAPGARWVGKDAARDLGRAAAKKHLAARAARSA